VSPLRRHRALRPRPTRHLVAVRAVVVHDDPRVSGDGDSVPQRRRGAARRFGVEQERRLIAGSAERVPGVQAGEPARRGDVAVGCDLGRHLTPIGAHARERGAHGAAPLGWGLPRRLPVLVLALRVGHDALSRVIKSANERLARLVI
jgi:hypothetical protein